ncbi:MAG: YkgJ family cysteine cluster protein [Myxococcales bacterium]|nr:YkgJ family cysteine cluster protein [Myxococcales bacterium]
MKDKRAGERGEVAEPAWAPPRMTDAELHDGIRFAHDLAMAALARAERAEAQLVTMRAALVARGVLSDSASSADSADSAAEDDVAPDLERSPLQRYQPALLVSTSAAPDKHTVPSADVDCQSLLHLCLGRCCRFRVILAYQDVEDGLRWVYERPYELRREADGYCTHFDREQPGCGVYQRRPAPCRTFDCRSNPSVWLDFERQIPVPMEEPLFQIRKRSK